MEELEYIIMSPTEQNIIMTEEMRYRAYGIKSGFDADEYYIEEILSERILVFLCLKDNEPVSACYVSSSFNSLYIDYLFVLPEYQNKGLHIGRKLLEYVIENKKIAEDFFNKEFNQSRLAAINEKNRRIYEKLGYEPQESSDLMIKKLS